MSVAVVLSSRVWAKFKTSADGMVCTKHTKFIRPALGDLVDIDVANQRTKVVRERVRVESSTAFEVDVVHSVPVESDPRQLGVSSRATVEDSENIYEHNYERITEKAFKEG
jgi:hypothetical protein